MASTRPFVMQAPEHIAMEYGGNKQRIAQAAQAGTIDPTAAVMAGMFIDKMRAAQMAEKAPQRTVAQQVMAPQPLPGTGGATNMPQGGPGPGAPPAPTPPPPPQGMPPNAPPMQGMPQGGPPPQPTGMAAGGLLAAGGVPDNMYDSYAQGGVVSFAPGDLVGHDYSMGYPSAYDDTSQFNLGDYLPDIGGFIQRQRAAGQARAAQANADAAQANIAQRAEQARWRQVAAQQQAAAAARQQAQQQALTEAQAGKSGISGSVQYPAGAGLPGAMTYPGGVGPQYQPPVVKSAPTPAPATAPGAPPAPGAAEPVAPPMSADALKQLVTGAMDPNALINNQGGLGVAAAAHPGAAQLAAQVNASHPPTPMRKPGKPASAVDPSKVTNPLVTSPTPVSDLVKQQIPNTAAGDDIRNALDAPHLQASMDIMKSISPRTTTAEDAMKARIAGEPDKLAAEKKEDMWQTLAEIGFGIASGTSRYALENIAQGTKQALPAMAQRTKDRRAEAAEAEKEAVALEGQDNAYNTAIATAAMGLTSSRAELAKAQEQIDVQKEQFGQDLGLKQQTVDIARQTEKDTAAYQRGELGARFAAIKAGDKAVAAQLRGQPFNVLYEGLYRNYLAGYGANPTPQQQIYAMHSAAADAAKYVAQMKPDPLAGLGPGLGYGGAAGRGAPNPYAGAQMSYQP